jgi:hypothetical protein
MQRVLTPIHKLFVPEKRTDRLVQVALLILSFVYSVVI